jgi:V/A-type H+-transporting ATPase subunit K
LIVVQVQQRICTVFEKVNQTVNEFNGYRKEVLLNMVDWGIPIGAGIAFGLGAIGTGYAQSKIGSAGAGTIAERPETFGLMVVLVAIPETMVILGFVVAAMLMIMLT